MGFILQQEKFVQFDWLRAAVFQLNLKYLHVKITNLFLGSIVRDIWHKYNTWYFKIVSNFTCLKARLIAFNNFEISLVVFMPKITTNHAITYTNFTYGKWFIGYDVDTVDGTESKFGKHKKNLIVLNI